MAMRTQHPTEGTTMNIYEEYKDRIESLDHVAHNVEVLAPNDAGRLVFPDGERPTLVDLALEAIRRGFRGPEAETLMRELARREWLFSAGADLAPDLYSWKDVPIAAHDVLKAAGYPDLIAEQQENEEAVRREIAEKYGR
jgi:hypothetical protein